MPDRPRLVRAIGRWDFTALVVNGVIGSGIFGLPAVLAGLTGLAAKEREVQALRTSAKPLLLKSRHAFAPEAAQARLNAEPALPESPGSKTILHSPKTSCLPSKSTL